MTIENDEDMIWRDNEHERRRIAQELEDLEDLDDEELEAVANGTAAEGDGALDRVKAARARSILDNRAEQEGTRRLERDFQNHWEGRPTSEDRDRQDLRDAGRGHLA